MEYNWLSMFENSRISFELYHPAVSQQNIQSKKLELRRKIKDITSKSPLIITDQCYIQIEYFCSHIRRYKNHGMYDLDNIIKPILDSLSGLDGIILDDSIFNGVSVNWIDTNDNERLSITVESSDLQFEKKEKLLIFKNNNWCFPVSKDISIMWKDIIKEYYKIWNNIQTEDDYYEHIGMLPYIRFIPYNKIKDKNYFIEDIEI